MRIDRGWQWQGEQGRLGGPLEYPQYTRPAVFRAYSVPDLLLSGDHAKIARWRRREALRRTFERRPDLLKKADLTEEDEEYLRGLEETT